jgi:hypothetical protein
MNYTQFVNELKNSHSDTIEILSDKLIAWLTTAGTTTFNLSSGDFTIQNVPNITLGKYTVEAGENITQNAPVRLYNDGGTIKAKALIESEIVDSNVADLLATDDFYYCSTYDRFLHLDSDGVANVLTAKIGTVASDGTITYGAVIPIYTGVDLYPVNTKLVSMGSEDFVIAILEDDNVIFIGGKFTNASTIVLGAEVDTSKTLVTNFSLASNGSDIVNLVFQTSSADELFSELYEYSNVDSSLVMIVSSDKTVSASTIINNSFRNCYDITNDVFHCIYSNIDATYEYMLHCSIDSLTGVLQQASHELSKVVRDKIHYCPSGLFYDVRTNNLILLSSTSYVDLNYTDLDLFRIEILLDDVMMINQNKILNASMRLHLDESSIISVYFDESRNVLVFNYSGYESDKSVLVEVALNDVPELKRFETYRFESGVSGYCGKSIIKTLNHYIFKPLLEAKIYSCNVEERDSYIGIANETKLSGADILVSLSGDTIATFAGLNVGSTYYLQKDMTLSTVKSNYPVGKAITTTSLRLF